MTFAFHPATTETRQKTSPASKVDPSCPTIDLGSSRTRHTTRPGVTLKAGKADNNRTAKGEEKTEPQRRPIDSTNRIFYLGVSGVGGRGVGGVLWPVTAGYVLVGTDWQPIKHSSNVWLTVRWFLKYKRLNEQSSRLKCRCSVSENTQPPTEERRRHRSSSSTLNIRHQSWKPECSWGVLKLLCLEKQRNEPLLN